MKVWLLGGLGHLRHRAGQVLGVFLGHDVQEMLPRLGPVVQQPGREAAAGFVHVAFHQLLQLGFPMRGGQAAPEQRVRVDPLLEGVVGVIDEGLAAGEACAEIVADYSMENRHVS